MACGTGEDSKKHIAYVIDFTEMSVTFPQDPNPLLDIDRLSMDP